MEKCNYCQIEYHPMPVWTSASKRIHVCNMTFTYYEQGGIKDIIFGSECEKKAEADGFMKRMDLTPRR